MGIELRFGVDRVHSMLTSRIVVCVGLAFALHFANAAEVSKLPHESFEDVWIEKNRLTSAEGAKQCHKSDKEEGCFGQQGPMCDAVATDPCWMQHDGKKKQLTSVGSLAHDMCCVLCPEGQMCNENWLGAKQGLTNMDDNVPCALEWRKAVWNQIDHRGWCEYKAPPRKIVMNGARKQYTVTGADGKNVQYMELPLTADTQKFCGPKGQALDC